MWRILPELFRLSSAGMVSDVICRNKREDDGEGRVTLGVRGGERRGESRGKEGGGVVNWSAAKMLHLNLIIGRKVQAVGSDNIMFAWLQSACISASI